MFAIKNPACRELTSKFLTKPTFFSYPGRSLLGNQIHRNSSASFSSQIDGLKPAQLIHQTDKFSNVKSIASYQLSTNTGNTSSLVNSAAKRGAFYGIPSNPTVNFGSNAILTQARAIHTSKMYANEVAYQKLQLLMKACESNEQQNRLYGMVDVNSSLLLDTLSLEQLTKKPFDSLQAKECMSLAGHYLSTCSSDYDYAKGDTYLVQALKLTKNNMFKIEELMKTDVDISNFRELKEALANFQNCKSAIQLERCYHAGVNALVRPADLSWTKYEQMEAAKDWLSKIPDENPKVAYPYVLYALKCLCNISMQGKKRNLKSGAYLVNEKIIKDPSFQIILHKLEVAVELGHLESRCLLALCYLLGAGTKKSHKLLYPLLQDYAALGSSDAMNCVSLFDRYGMGTKY